MTATGQSRPRLLRVTSPDGKVIIALDPDGLQWSMTYGGNRVIAPSPLALEIAEARELGPGAHLFSARTRDLRGTWTPPYGIRAQSTEACSELIAMFEDRQRHIRFAIVLRAYDAGAALRWRLISTPMSTLTLTGERTGFRLPVEATLYASRDEGSYQRTIQTRIAPVPHPDLTASSDKGDLADTPLTAALPDGTTLLITESDRLHYPRMMLKSAQGGVETYLMRYPGRATGYSGPGDTPAEGRFTLPTPFETPWRVVLAAPSPVALLERQDLIPTLASPNRLGDVSWIKPGRAMRIAKYTTQDGLDVVDFAAARKLDYVEWDAHWYGDGTDSSDATQPIPAIDIEKVISHAKSKGLGLILYVDRVPAMRQLDAIVKTYQRWGVAGIKFGFVWEGRQSDIDFITNLVKTCGEHDLLVNLHDNLRPAGLERTYPNYIALEGVRGNEQFPTATHNCTLPFTRALSGPIDYTICYANPKNRTTNAHQLAMAVVYYNPLTFLYWYDTPSKYAGVDWPDLVFFDECPTSWEETCALSGAIGDHTAVARKANGKWFLGAITNEQARNLTIPLRFLGAGRWKARRFADGARGERAYQTPVVLSEEIVDAGRQFDMKLVASGGQAVIFEPI
ncbi:MAG TPA: glycoside hydrolase family 97 catalytic domain-containing protein [Sphingomonas sp.]|nr:glycoside hydrolase family 97 catalytic domain-containing protein [Sphingomonas sp.]